MASRDENEELDQSGSSNQEHEEEEVEDQQNAEVDEEQAENDGEHNESAAEVASNHNGESKVSSDNESDEEFAGFGEDEIEVTAQKRAVVSDESGDENQEDDDEEEGIQARKSRNAIGSDEEAEDGNDSNQEGENEETEQVMENDNNEHGHHENVEQHAQESSDEEEFARPNKKARGDGPTDLELMLMKNKAQKAKNRRKKGGDSDEINDWDNKISAIISEMKSVAAEDRAANEKQIMSLQKQKMLPLVRNMLEKTDYHATMIELGVLGAIAEWLAPLPDRSLPNISIRDFMISTLVEFGEVNADYLKSSGIGKAVMFLFKHSKETKENKKKLERLINDWSRPIFNLDGNFKQLSKEERLERDLEHVKTMNKKERLSNKNLDDDLLDATQVRKSKKSKAKEAQADAEPKKFLRPGDVGFCPRARVPIPSSKDYVIRPKSNVEVMETESSRKGGKKAETRFDKHKKRFEEIKKSSKSSRAVTMVAAGGK